MENVTTIAEEFSLFADVEIPEDAPQVQHKMMRAAFYAGAGSALRNVREISRNAPNAVIGITAIQCLENEAEEFAVARIIEGLEQSGGGVFVVRIRHGGSEE